MLWTFRFRHLDAKVIVTVNVVLDRFKFPFQGVHKFTEEKLKSLGDELAKAKATKRKRTRNGPIAPPPLQLHRSQLAIVMPRVRVLLQYFVWLRKSLRETLMIGTPTARR